LARSPSEVGPRLRKAFLLSVLSLLALSAVPGAFAQIISGQMQGGANDTSGTSSFTVLYSYPAEITKPGTFAINFTLEVNSLTGQRLNVYTFGYAVSIFWSTGAAQNGHYQYNTIKYLYPGAHSPVANVTFPVNDTALQLPPGQKAVGTITVTTIVQVYYGPPVSFYFPDTFHQTIGNVTFSDRPLTATSSSASTTQVGPPGPALSLYTVLGAGIIVVAVVAGVGYSLMQRRRGSPPSGVPDAKGTS